jgi:hypothetical protein
MSIFLLVSVQGRIQSTCKRRPKMHKRRYATYTTTQHTYIHGKTHRRPKPPATAINERSIASAKRDEPHQSAGEKEAASERSGGTPTKHLQQNQGDQNRNPHHLRKKKKRATPTVKAARRTDLVSPIPLDTPTNGNRNGPDESPHTTQHSTSTDRNAKKTSPNRAAPDVVRDPRLRQPDRCL